MKENYYFISHPNEMNKQDYAFLKKGRLLLLFFFLLFTFQIWGQGTQCSNATPITINGACITNHTIVDTGQNAPNVGSTGPNGSVCATGTFRREGWYTFTVTGGPLNVTITASSADRNLYIQLISQTGACAGIAQIACANNDTNTNSAQTETISNVSLNNGTYYIKVSNVGNNNDMILNSLCVVSPPANDDCTGAIPLTVNTSGTCTYTTYSNANSTASTTPSTPPAPGCSSYLGSDVWFSFVVPASGEVTIDTQTGVMTDGGMAWYTGACGSLTLLECDDDDSANGLMPYITRTGLTPGATIYVRFWEYGNDNNGTFGICASTRPICATPTAQPTALSLTPAGGNISGSFTAASPAPSNYLVVYNTTGATPSPANNTTYTVGGTVGAGNIVADIDTNTSFSVSGLNSSTTYYFFVFSYNNSSCAGPVYLTTTPLTGNATTGIAYCTPVTTSTLDYISNFTTTGGFSNFSHSSASSQPAGYGDFYTTYSASQAAGASLNFSETYVGGSHGFNIWVDWNNDGDFADAGEKVFGSAAIAGGHSGSFTVPGGTPIGDYRMRIRAWYNNNNPDPCTSITYGEAKDYKLTVTAPLPCAGIPSNITVSAITATTATVSWTAAAPAPASGYQYYLSTSSTAPTAGTTPTGSTGAGVLTTGLTALTQSTTYYVWVRSNCGGGLGQGLWIGPVSFTTPCMPGGGTGTSTLGCPNVISGGLGLNGADPAPITCTSGSNCVNLEATYLQLGSTTNYTAQSIPYNPPYQFSCLANPVSVNQDDVWSPLINLPFNFCFYGNTYNTCSIGSNGVLTFDATRAGTASGYSFSNNLPSTTGALFANTIYGVYHDIDPSVGGEVGWELITLNSGCRALVASWSNVPMFSDNSILYTGMMVLYENTNIIEVYIKEKRIDGTWNGGNAIVGVQNAAGTQAVTAPGRNGLDTDWTVTNEAWRFVPSGTSITSFKWYEGAGTTGPVLGTTATLNVCPTATTTYTAEVTYTLCNGTTLKETDQTTVTVSAAKTWNGSVDTDWSKANNWTPAGVPTVADCVIIPNVTNDPIISGSGYTGLGLNLTIQTGAILTVNTANNLSIVDYVNINAGGDLVLQNSASLVQTNNVANTGTAHIRRNSQPMYRLDYTYWNSPVTAASGFTVGNLNANSPYIYRYTPTVAGGNGTWASLSAGSVMNPTYGVIARAPGTFPTSGAKQTYTATFTGTPNNGTVTMPISKGTNANIGSTTPSGGSTVVTDADDEWNLIGNPYPSAIDIVSFLNHPANVPVIDGTVYLWTHNTLPTAASPDPYYGNYSYNYTVNDYATVNSLGATATATTGGTMPTTYIASGQSFFISADNAMANGTTGNVTFNNSMRVLNNNSNFYRNTAGENTTDTFTKQRLWLNLSNNNGGFSQILVGYAESATLGWDRGLDGESLAGNAVKFYSLIENRKLTIQGRPLPFEQQDVVPLGYKATSQGTYTIGIDHLDSEFSNTDVYLEDKLLNVVHNLKLAPYSYSSQAGTFDNRFYLRYTQTTLGNEEVANLAASVNVFTDNTVKITSSIEPIKNIVVYDVLGRKIDEYKNVAANQMELFRLTSSNNALIIKITLENDMEISKKIIY
ncbi:GEVED domain-containing protein [Flavobacterium pedocola]